VSGTPQPLNTSSCIIAKCNNVNAAKQNNQICFSGPARIGVEWLMMLAIQQSKAPLAVFLPESDSTRTHPEIT
jgi:hypothetical protein